ncbi:hypothetical protein JYU34_005359 [Plutella xylostella]|uniref:Uncharacterized protein n=1 Tax=Plutella xylostella TaxID=51655 RepID=A0ABQ7QWH2_PLUXY|nr:hypothetical protein JYU34_008553 [Plutella xylostella]KAG7309395.1 hypothetical protein JYU34_005359 [Plutella xylostella]
MSKTTFEGARKITGRASEIAILTDGSMAIVTSPPTPPPSPPTIHIPETGDTVAGIEIRADGTVYIQLTPPPPQTTPPPPTTPHPPEITGNSNGVERRRKKIKRGGKKKIRGPNRGLARLPRWEKR